MSKFLILGLGSAGQRHMRLLHEMRPAAHILTADPFGQLHPSDPAVIHYSDWKLLLAHHPDATGIIIASPTEFHLEQLRACMERNLPVFCEKPIMTTAQYLADAWGWLRGIDLSATFCGVNFQYRFDPGLAWAAEPPAPSLLSFSGQDDLLARYGPNVGEIMAAHPIDSACYLLGDPVDVTGETDGVAISVTIAHPGIGISRHSFRMDGGPRSSYLRCGLRQTTLGHADNYRKALAAWLAWVETGQRDPRTATLADGLRVSEVLARVRHLENVAVS